MNYNMLIDSGLCLQTEFAKGDESSELTVRFHRLVSTYNLEATAHEAEGTIVSSHVYYSSRSPLFSEKEKERIMRILVCSNTKQATLTPNTHQPGILASYLSPKLQKLRRFTTRKTTDFEIHHHVFKHIRSSQHTFPNTPIPPA
ncbi:unnamed protein product [Periconia digitata]|uniref:Uncharacterized protein n=1 Tax=Periconia digitata TaxID=1303443 RepID=A0A9W4UFS2_9PLEO|nr:unnamed protein product [Periconia digitata]